VSAHQPSCPCRIQRKRVKGWRLPEGARCVDRSTEFGNPYLIKRCVLPQTLWAIGTWAGHMRWYAPSKHEAAKIAADAYRTWISAPERVALLEKARRELRGMSLACFCPLGQACHADVLLEIANG
jgi:hypothetical protein